MRDPSSPRAPEMTDRKIPTGTISPRVFSETSPPRALVFDSGVGGLSVAADIHAALPGLVLTYAADNAFLPYGEKSEAELIARVPELLEGWRREFAPDLIVVACNTASTVVLPAVRALVPVPVIGVVPAVKPAAKHTRTGIIGLLGTPGTVRRAYTDGLIREFAADKTVIRHGSSGLVRLAEAKLRGHPPDEAAVAAEIAPLFAGTEGANIDIVVLACTHFPLLRSELARAAARPVQFIDSGAAIARRVAQLLPDRAREIALRDGPPGLRPALFTAMDDTLPALEGALNGFGFSALRQMASER